MIELRNERLAPVGLGELLYQAVPRSLHRPIYFICCGRTGLLGHCGHGRIDIHLHYIYTNALGHTQGSIASGMWRKLIEVCYHEFGHVATGHQCRHISEVQYRADRRVHSYVELLADDWARARLAELQTRDSRLGQPILLTGYLGGRHARLMRGLASGTSGKAKATYVAERRCLATGGQFTVGQLANELNLGEWRCGNALSVIRSASDGIGIDYVDRASRRHKLYTWGDLPKIGERLDLSRLKPARLPDACRAAASSSSAEVGLRSVEGFDPFDDYDPFAEGVSA